MSQAVRANTYFTRYLFRAGLGCPTKLFYKANNYPESLGALPFIAHNHYNKNQVKALARCSWPEGVLVNESTVEDAFSATARSVDKEKVTLFEAVFIWQDMLVKFPILEKYGDSVNVFHIQTKAFNPGKHRLANNLGHIYPKWMDYLTDFAFQLYVVRQLYPQWDITPFLVLPDKGSIAKPDKLHEMLKTAEHKAVKPAGIQTAGEELLVKIDVGDLIKTVWNGEAFKDTPFEGQSFDQVVNDLKKLYFNGEKYPAAIGSKCKDCEFRIDRDRIDSGEISGFGECWEQETEKNTAASDEMVFDLIGPGTDTWIERKLYFQHQVPREEITDVQKIAKAKGGITERQRQALQILKAKGDRVPEEIVKPRLFDELRHWKFPIHFLDFEAGNYTIPVKSGRRPYHLVVFQYSCHSLQRDGNWQHFEWIDDSHDGYPSYECVRHLRNVPCIEEGTIVQYSNFERNALRIIRKELQWELDDVPDAGDLIKWIEHFINRNDSNGGEGPYLADLSRMVRNFYYNDQMGNSLSIKDVVQSVLTKSSYLKQTYSRPYSSSNFDSVIWWQPDQGKELVRSPYSIMTDQQSKISIGRGTEAMVVYGKLLNGMNDEAEKRDQINALLKYCELDTLAMLMIYQHWQALLRAS